MGKAIVSLLAAVGTITAGSAMAQGGGRWVITADQRPYENDAQREAARRRNAEAVAKAKVANAFAEAERVRRQKIEDAEVAKRTAAIQQQNAMAAHRSAEAFRIGKMATDAWKAKMKAQGCDVDAPSDPKKAACGVSF